MTHYLLSVPGSVDDQMPSGEVVQEMFAAVGKFNDKVREAGRWVFAGDLEPIATATTVLTLTACDSSTTARFTSHTARWRELRPIARAMRHPPPGVPT